MTTTMSGLSQDTGAWLETGAGRFKFALGLLPFAGLFFLWFIAVARERLGRFEDQFFSTIFLGSGLLFLAMMFAAAASAGALVATYAHDPAGFAASSTYFYARQIVAQIFGIYALTHGRHLPDLAGHALGAHRGDAALDGSAHLRAGARPALHLHAVPVGHPRLPGVGAHGQRVHPRRASRPERRPDARDHAPQPQD